MFNKPELTCLQNLVVGFYWPTRIAIDKQWDKLSSRSLEFNSSAGSTIQRENAQQNVLCEGRDSMIVACIQGTACFPADAIHPTGFISFALRRRQPKHEASPDEPSITHFKEYPLEHNGIMRASPEGAGGSQAWCLCTCSARDACTTRRLRCMNTTRHEKRRDTPLEVQRHPHVFLHTHNKRRRPQSSGCEVDRLQRCNCKSAQMGRIICMRSTFKPRL